ALVGEGAPVAAGSPGIVILPAFVVAVATLPLAFVTSGRTEPPAHQSRCGGSMKSGRPIVAVTVTCTSRPGSAGGVPLGTAVRLNLQSDSWRCGTSHMDSVVGMRRATPLETLPAPK